MVSRPEFKVIKWRDAFPHAVHVRVDGGTITGVCAEYAPWRGRNLFDVLKQLSGYSSWVKVTK